MVKIKGSWLVTGETSFDDDVSDSGTVAYCLQEDLDDAGGFNVDSVVPYDIQFRSQKAAEEIFDGIKEHKFDSGYAVDYFTAVISRNFSEGEE